MIVFRIKSFPTKKVQAEPLSYFLSQTTDNFYAGYNVAGNADLVWIF